MTYRQGFDRLGNPVAKPQRKRISTRAHHAIQVVAVVVSIVLLVILAAPK
jgi:hypothetical protein